MRDAVSFVVRRDPDDRGSPVLAVRRPPNDEELPDLWGLPATTLEAGESWEDALVRAGREKLGISLEPGRLLAEGSQDRRRGEASGAGTGYLLRMRVYEARIRRGEPDVPQSGGEGTQYVAWGWMAPDSLRPAAETGSLCTRLFLDRRSG